MLEEVLFKLRKSKAIMISIVRLQITCLLGFSLLFFDNLLQCYLSVSRGTPSGTLGNYRRFNASMPGIAEAGGIVFTVVHLSHSCECSISRTP